MINLSTFIKCSNCFETYKLSDNLLKYVYKHLEKNLINTYIEITDGRCTSQEEYLRMCALAKQHADTLQFLLDTEKKQV